MSEPKRAPIDWASVLSSAVPRKTALSPLILLCAITGIANSVSGGWVFWLFAVSVTATIVAYFVILVFKDAATLQSEPFRERMKEIEQKGVAPPRRTVESTRATPNGGGSGK